MSLSREQEMLEELQPYIDADPEGGQGTITLISAIAQMAEPISSIIRDSDAGPGWSALVDPDRCPAEWLDFPAQIIGVILDHTLGEAAQRLQIKSNENLNRGTLAAQILVAQLTLTGTRAVIPYERDGGNAWQQRFVTLTSETPDPPATLAALKSQKPIGIVLTHEVGISQTWADLKARSTTWTWQDTMDHFNLWSDVRSNNAT